MTDTATSPDEREENAPGEGQQDVSLGTVGLLMSTVGTLLTFGVLSPIGLVVSLFALRQSPRKHAILGVIVGVVGIAMLAVLLFAIYATYFMESGDDALSELFDRAALQRADSLIKQWQQENDRLPTLDVGQRLIDNIQDRWGRPILYIPIGDRYVIFSAGEDGELETLDDIFLISPEE